ncbi:RagB/SusD family nutrient uptake outer membrane protein [Arcticibacter sp.]|uniref:RagB/SusD family nutrient uptake outer membrane protein n=1 Tax=Arcticibacter sp. TaxID=1872630 RepID=UPI00388FE1C2
MKKQFSIYMLLLSMIAFSSCDKYLDIEPTGRVIPTTSEDFRALLSTAYKNFSDHKSLLAIRTDEILLDEYSYDYSSLRDIYKWNDNNPDAVTIEFPYQRLYTTIFYANEVIAQVENRVGVNEETAQMKGEAYLLRAYCHFELLNMYAQTYNKNTAGTDRGVPISLQMDLEENYVPATIEEVYAQVLTDIEDGKKHLNVENFPTGKNYRFTTRAALALEARVNEFKGDWNAALAASEKGLQMNNQLEDLNIAGSLLPNHYMSVENIMSMEKTFNVILSTSTYISDHLIGAYNKENDLRLPKYFSFSSGTYKSAKGQSDELKISFRNGELYLIRAEAALQLGNTDLARESLLTLKSKRLKPDYYNTEETRIRSLSPQNLMDEIIAERERELALEGHRWYDLRRYGQPALTHEVEGETFTLQHNDPRYTLRFPRSAVARNPNLQ